MQKTSVAVNESAGVIDSSLLLPLSKIVSDDQSDSVHYIQSISSNMEEISATSSTDDLNATKIVQSEYETNALENDTKSVNAMPCNSLSGESAIKRSNDNARTTDSAAIDKTKETETKALVPINSNEKPAKKKTVFLNAPHLETICDDISSTTENIKRLKHVHVRSNSTGKLYQSSRRVSFPENDSELVTGYLEPADPWACG